MCSGPTWAAERDPVSKNKIQGPKCLHGEDVLARSRGGSPGRAEGWSQVPGAPGFRSTGEKLPVCSRLGHHPGHLRSLPLPRSTVCILASCMGRRGLGRPHPMAAWLLPPRGGVPTPRAPLMAAGVSAAHFQLVWIPAGRQQAVIFHVLGKHPRARQLLFTSLSVHFLFCLYGTDGQSPHSDLRGAAPPEATCPEFQQI